MCYAVDVCNQFSSLPVESAPVLALSVDEIPAKFVGNHFENITESFSQESSVPDVVGEAPILSMRCGILQRSSEVDDSLNVVPLWGFLSQLRAPRYQWFLECLPYLLSFLLIQWEVWQ